MKRRVIHALLIVLISLPYTAFSQSTKYRGYKYEWGAAKPVKKNIDPQFAASDAVILEENNIIRIDENNYFFIEKYLRVKLLTAKGVQDFSRITLPETFDPQYDYRELPFGKNDRHGRHWYYDMQVMFFAARVIKPDGALQELKVTDKIIPGKEFVGSTYYNAFTYDFNLGALELNDEVEIRYKYFVPFSEYYSGSSGRFFFHGPFPKQDHRLSITYDKDLRYYFFVQNGALPSDTIIANPQDPEVGLEWRRQNLFAVGNEPGALLHKDLPYVRFYKHFGDYGMYSKKNIGQMTKVLPYTWQYFASKRKSYFDRGVEVSLTVSDKNTMGLKRLYENAQKEVTDTSMAVKFAKVHSVIANDFNYVSSYERYRQNNYLWGPGEAADKKILYEEYRYEVYSRLMDRTRRMYYMAYIGDKRIEDIDYDNYYPILSAHQMFCLPYGDEMMYYYPKFARFGYEANELPFYLENAKMVLVPRNMNEIYLKRMYEPPPRFMVSPASDEKTNVRTGLVNVDVSLDSASATFDAAIKLEGQFSTMTRPAYLYNLTDSSANTKYGLRIFDINKTVKVKQKEIVSQSAVFPFTNNIKVNYSAKEIVKKNDDGTYTIDLSGWFHHIIYEGFTSSSRRLAFYPDFRLTDTYTYRIKFDRNISMLNSSDHEAEIDNAFGKYSLYLKQVSANEIEIGSVFIVKAAEVPANETKQVEAIYSKIEKLNKGVVKVKID